MTQSEPGKGSLWGGPMRSRPTASGSARIGQRRWWGIPTAAGCALLGGLLVRYGAVTTPGELLRRGPSTLVSFAPEQGRHVGERGADIGNHGTVGKPRSKLPRES